MENRIVLKTSISSSLMKYTLFKGLGMALPGVGALLFGGIYLPPSLLSTWGIGLFALSMGLITIGLLPYKRLARVQLKPNEIHLVESPDQFEFYAKGVKLFSVPFESVEKLECLDQKNLYGIICRLKHPPPSPVVVHQEIKQVEEMRKQGLKYQADLFLPYFNRRAFQEMSDWQTTIPPEQDHEDE